MLETVRSAKTYIQLADDVRRGFSRDTEKGHTPEDDQDTSLDMATQGIAPPFFDTDAKTLWHAEYDESRPENTDDPFFRVASKQTDLTHTRHLVRYRAIHLPLNARYLPPLKNPLECIHVGNIIEKNLITAADRCKVYPFDFNSAGLPTPHRPPFGRPHITKVSEGNWVFTAVQKTYILGGTRFTLERADHFRTNLRVPIGGSRQNANIPWMVAGAYRAQRGKVSEALSPSEFVCDFAQVDLPTFIDPDRSSKSQIQFLRDNPRTMEPIRKLAKDISTRSYFKSRREDIPMPENYVRPRKDQVTNVDYEDEDECSPMESLLLPLGVPVSKKYDVGFACLRVTATEAAATIKKARADAERLVEEETVRVAKKKAKQGPPKKRGRRRKSKEQGNETTKSAEASNEETSGSDSDDSDSASETKESPSVEIPKKSLDNESLASGFGSSDVEKPAPHKPESKRKVPVEDTTTTSILHNYAQSSMFAVGALAAVGAHASALARQVDDDVLQQLAMNALSASKALKKSSAQALQDGFRRAISDGKVSRPIELKDMSHADIARVTNLPTAFEEKVYSDIMKLDPKLSETQAEARDDVLMPLKQKHRLEGATEDIFNEMAGQLEQGFLNVIPGGSAAGGPSLTKFFGSSTGSTPKKSTETPVQSVLKKTHTKGVRQPKESTTPSSDRKRKHSKVSED